MKLQLAELTLEKKDGNEQTIMQRLKVSSLSQFSPKHTLLTVIGFTISSAQILMRDYIYVTVKYSSEPVKESRIESKLLSPAVLLPFPPKTNPSPHHTFPVPSIAMR